MKDVALSPDSSESVETPTMLKSEMKCRHEHTLRVRIS